MTAARLWEMKSSCGKGGKPVLSRLSANCQHHLPRKELAVQSTFERMGGTYRQEGDYLLPNLLPPVPPNYRLGKYGRMRQRYLKEHRSPIYTAMFLRGTLFDHLAEIDRTCNEQVDQIVTQMVRREGVTEAMKPSDRLAWVRKMNCIQNRAEEIVLSELVYC